MPNLPAHAAIHRRHAILNVFPAGSVAFGLLTGQLVVGLLHRRLFREVVFVNHTTILRRIVETTKYLTNFPTILTFRPVLSGLCHVTAVLSGLVSGMGNIVYV